MPYIRPLHVQPSIAVGAVAGVLAPLFEGVPTMNRFLSLGALVASLVLASGEVSAQRLSVNPYQGLGFGISPHTDLCKVGTSGVDADARHTADHIAEAPGTPPQLSRIVSWNPPGI